MDEILFRKLKPGNQYQSLFPNVTCERVALGKGDTDYSIDKMVEWILKHQNQTVKVAQLLEKSSLQNTCESIHDFCYNHFQYKADLEDQLLRSPACAWKQRYDGIDCKSYSIVASCLLLNLGINHYIKKVAYTVPGEYTHVYVVVPINQETCDLNDGYYMIDGTLPTMQEPYCIDEKNELMSLQHYGLNRPNQLNGFDFSSLKQLKISDVKNLFGFLSCIGGSAYTNGLLDANLNKLTSLFNSITADLNKNIASNNLTAASENIADFYGWISTLRWAHSAKLQDGWNSCSTKNFNVFLDTAKFIQEKVYAVALMAYIDKYFNKKLSGIKHHYTNVGLESQGWTFMEMDYYTHNEDVELYTLTIKPGITQIPAFEFTQPLLDAHSNNLDVTAYLNSLQNIINVVKPNTPIDGGGYVDTSNDTNPDGTPKSSGSGIGTLLGIGAVGLAVKYLIFS